VRIPGGSAALGAALAVVAGCGEDSALITAASLTLDPCKDGKPRTFEPFRFEADLLRWYGASGGGQVEMRRGWKASTMSDQAVLQFPDLDAVRARMDAGEDVPIDGKVARMSIALRATCPGSGAALAARDGVMQVTSLDTSVGGRIAGAGTFDIWEERALAEPEGTVEPLARGATLRFDMEVRRGTAYEGFSR